MAKISYSIFPSILNFILCQCQSHTMTVTITDMHKICPRYAWDMPKICTRYAQDMPEICLRYARDMPEICPRYAQDIPKICPIYAQDMQWIPWRYGQDMPSTPLICVIITNICDIIIYKRGTVSVSYSMRGYRGRYLPARRNPSVGSWPLLTPPANPVEFFWLKMPSKCVPWIVLQVSCSTCTY